VQLQSSKQKTTTTVSRLRQFTHNFLKIPVLTDTIAAMGIFSGGLRRQLGKIKLLWGRLMNSIPKLITKHVELFTSVDKI